MRHPKVTDEAADDPECMSLLLAHLREHAPSPHELSSAEGTQSHTASGAAGITVAHAQAFVNCANTNGDTPMSFAIASGLERITHVLLSVPGIVLGSGGAPGALSPVALAQKLKKLDTASLILHTQVRVVWGYGLCGIRCAY